MDTAGFREWLGQSDLSDRGRRDVCSRLNRIDKLVGLSGVQSRADLDVAIIRSGALTPLTPSVRSQLKRAASLWLDYQGQSK